MTIIPIDDDDAESILYEFRDGFDSPMIDVHFISHAYPQWAHAGTQTQAEREAALREMRDALIEALCKLGVPLEDATVYIARHEYLTRSSMIEVDDLMVSPMLWMSSWAPPRWRHREGMAQLWNREVGP